MLHRGVSESAGARGETGRNARDHSRVCKEQMILFVGHEGTVKESKR